MIEQTPALWYIAFAVDIALGSLCFYITINKPIRSGFDGLFWWFGWWAYVDAFALMLNSMLGTNNFWSYHQTGIIIDTAINIGLLAYIIKTLWANWALNKNDWAKIEEVAKEAKIRELSNDSK